jgi:anti-anti-sigma regulatory factor
VKFPAPGTEVPVLRNHADEVASDLRFDAIGGVVLIDASGELDDAMAERLGDHLEQIRGGSRPVVLDLTRVTEVGDDALAVLRRMWREVGDGMRVVATPGSAPARAIKGARLRRFAVHATLSGALADASMTR